MNSKASTLITDSFRELSRRCGERGERAVVKLLYDRGNIKQVYDPHQSVNEATRVSKAVGLPPASEMPNIDLQVVNYHRFPLGTFHAKFMIVDRRYGVVGSNNIQDNDNLEMAVHLEGPIVNSLYDTALISWHHELEPPLPCIAHPENVKAVPTFEQSSFRELFDSAGQPVAVSSNDPGELPEHLPSSPHYDPDIASEVLRVRSTMLPRNSESTVALVARHLNATTSQTRSATASPCPANDTFQPYWPHAPHAPFPIALVNRKPYGFPNHKCPGTPQSTAWLSAINNATSTIFLQTPNLNAAPLLPALLSACRRGVRITANVCLGYNDAGELLPMQNGHNELVASRLFSQLEPEHRKNLDWCYYVAKDQDRPVHNKFKGRSCHIKIMIVDGKIGIQGNGNLDTQSFFHSQEVNIMVDSERVCGEWMEALRRNQSSWLQPCVEFASNLTDLICRHAHLR
jgi:phosphatidylserine/phosphatidylglycerophosphate/cardiolipin synthase-like enzyme